jgi:hypothetical protein
MISNVVSNCFIGNMGGHAARYFIDQGLSGKVATVDPRSHLPCRHVRKNLKLTGPILGIIRNPFDWYIATWRTELQYHRWRGSFEDWFYHRKHIGGQYLRDGPVGEGAWLWDTFMYFAEIEPGGGPVGYTHIMRYECLQQDLIAALEDIGVIPKYIKGAWIEEKFGWAIRNYDFRQWFEGVEQWMRPDLFTPQMVSCVYEQDAPIFERFGYSFEERTYYQGGAGISCHGTRISDWEDEKKLSEFWVEWGPERPGPFVKPLPIISNSDETKIIPE